MILSDTLAVALFPRSSTCIFSDDRCHIKGPFWIAMWCNSSLHWTRLLLNNGDFLSCRDAFFSYTVARPLSQVLYLGTWIESQSLNAWLPWNLTWTRCWNDATSTPKEKKKTASTNKSFLSRNESAILHHRLFSSSGAVHRHRNHTKRTF